MHGLNTHQTVYGLVPISLNMDTGSAPNYVNQLSGYYAIPIDNPSVLRTQVPGFALAENQDVQWWFKRLYRTATISNVGSFPVYMTVAKVRARRDQIPSLVNRMEIDGVGLDIPYTSPFTGDQFRKNYKLLSLKSYTLNSGRMKRFSCGSWYTRRGRPITQEVEGEETYYARRGNTYLFIKFHGMPLNGNDNEGNLAYSPIIIRGVVSSYFSWYRLDDVEATSTVTNNIPAILTTVNTRTNPTYTNAVTSTLQPVMVDYNRVYANTPV